MRGGSAVRPVVAVAGRARRVDRELRDDAAALERLGAVGAHARQDVQVAVEVHARRDRVGDGGIVPGVDVRIHDGHELDEVDGLERRARHGARLAGCVRAERDDGGEPAGAALGHRDGRAPPGTSARSFRSSPAAIATPPIRACSGWKPGRTAW